MTEQLSPETTSDRPVDPKKELLKQAVRFMYDAQKLRIQSGLRAGSKTAELNDKQSEILGKISSNLSDTEKLGLNLVKLALKPFPIYSWLKQQKGVGPMMSGVLISEFDITRAETASQFWSFCGLGVKDGHAQRRRAGEKAGYNPWLKAKVVKVMAECMIKAKSPWRQFYDNYKHRKQHELVPVCMGCEGTKKRTDPKTKKKNTCSNCKGTGKNAPWGKSDAHRHQAAMRYMVKMFLIDFHKNWREIEGLPVRAPYAEAVLGRKHGDHGGTNIERNEEPRGHLRRVS